VDFGQIIGDPDGLASGLGSFKNKPVKFGAVYDTLSTAELSFSAERCFADSQLMFVHTGVCGVDIGVGFRNLWDFAFLERPVLRALGPLGLEINRGHVLWFVFFVRYYVDPCPVCGAVAGV
jgi:hypothetical protein